MRIINKKYLLIILLIGIILTGAIVLKPKENIQLDNVILKQEINNKTFAMYKEESENNYEPVEGTKFPEGYVLNTQMSKCIDNNGNEIKDALSYENDKVVLKSNRSSYCYLYFDKSLGEEIKEDNPQGLSAEIKGEMYRFQGQATDTINNYICFGTNDKSACTQDTDKYMYRIIGIEAETGRVKIIKKEALNNAVQWWDNYDDIEFPQSIIYDTISKSGFLENADYVPVDEKENINWKEKIANNTWMYGYMSRTVEVGANQTGEGLYLVETGQNETEWYIKSNEGDEGAQSYVVGADDFSNKGQTFYYIRHANENWTKTFEGQVSLMYLHDYYYSVGDEINCAISSSDNIEKCKTSWIHLSQNDVDKQGMDEWTMVCEGLNTWFGKNMSFFIRNDGFNMEGFYVNKYYVRPVFYISASEELLDGTGTITDPFVIKL